MGGGEIEILSVWVLHLPTITQRDRWCCGNGRLTPGCSVSEVSEFSVNLSPDAIVVRPRHPLLTPWRSTNWILRARTGTTFTSKSWDTAPWVSRRLGGGGVAIRDEQMVYSDFDLLLLKRRLTRTLLLTLAPPTLFPIERSSATTLRL